MSPWEFVIQSYSVGKCSNSVLTELIPNTINYMSFKNMYIHIKKKRSKLVWLSE